MNVEIYEKNKQVLLEYYFVQIEDEYEDTDPVLADVAEVEGRKILYVNKEDEIYHMDSMYDSEQLLSIWMKGFTHKVFNSKFIVFGLGNGMYVRKFLQEVPATNGVLIYEPSMAIFRKVMEEFDITDLLMDRRVMLFLPVTELVRYDNFLDHYLTVVDITGCLSYSYPNYRKLFQKEYEMNRSQIENAMVTEGSEAYLLFREGYHFYDSIFANMKKFIHGKSLWDFKRKFPKDTPIIIVSAGPSLDKNIDLLRKAKGKSLIIAVDTALRPMLKKDIIPDMFVSVDVRKHLGHFEDIRTREIPSIGIMTSRAEIINRHNAIQFFVADTSTHINNTLRDMNKKLVGIDAGGTVSQVAYAVAKWLGTSTIILVGQDLAYTNGQSHSSTTVRGESKVDLNGAERIPVPDVDGGTVLTSRNMFLYLQWYNRKLKDAKGITIIDATEGGAKIEGTEIMTLEAAIAENCTQEVNWEKIFSGIEDHLTMEQQIKFQGEIDQLSAYFLKLIPSVEKGIRNYEKMLELIYKNKYHGKEMGRLFGNITEISDILNESGEMIYVQLNMKVEEQDLIKDIYQTKEDEKEELIEAVGRGLSYFHIIKDKLNYVAKDLASRFETKE